MCQGEKGERERLMQASAGKTGPGPHGNDGMPAAGIAGKGEGRACFAERTRASCVCVYVCMCVSLSLCSLSFCSVKR